VRSPQVKKSKMPVLKIKQLQYETDSWKRILDFMMDENIHLKNRLSAILNDKFDTNLLEAVERFYSIFVKQDDLIRLLRNNLAELDQLLTTGKFYDEEILDEIEFKFSNLRNNIDYAERQFAKLKLEFNSYLSENI
jgi:hypothetical protein